MNQRGRPNHHGADVRLNHPQTESSRGALLFYHASITGAAPSFFLSLSSVCVMICHDHPPSLSLVHPSSFHMDTNAAAMIAR